MLVGCFLRRGVSGAIIAFSWKSKLSPEEPLEPLRRKEVDVLTRQWDFPVQRPLNPPGSYLETCWLSYDVMKVQLQ
jgi:hypothetical protein